MSITYLYRVRSDLRVYCGPTTSNNYISYDRSKALSIGLKFGDDESECPLRTAEPSLYRFWKQHPSIRELCCYSGSKYHETIITNILQYNSDYYESIGCLTSATARELRSQLQSLCSSSLSDPFCHIKPALGIIDLAARLPSNKAQWTPDQQTYGKVIHVSIAILKRLHPTLYSGVTLNEDEVLVDSTNTILRHIQNKDIQKLKAFAEYLPANDAYMGSATRCNNNNLCIFMRVVRQTRAYLSEVELETNPVVLNGKKRSILNTATDYREFLRQKQLNRILTVLAEQQVTSVQIAQDLKQHTASRFSELRSYFEGVETFNKQIANADIGFINGRLNDYKTSSMQIAKEVQTDVTFLLIQTFIAAGYDVAERTIVLAMQVAEALNPLKFIFGGGSAQDVVAATAALANAISNIVKLASVQRTFNRLKDQSISLAIRLEKNDDFLLNVRNLIEQDTVTREQFQRSRDTFIQQYNAYNPQVTRPEIAEIASLWIGVIESACGVLDSIDSASGSAVKSVIYNGGYCSRPQTLAEKMIATYEEIYDFQFDLIDAMASYVRSSVALDAASGINTDFTDVSRLNVNSAATLNTLAIMGGLSYITYRSHLCHAIRLYCDVLEYMEGGNMPGECEGLETDLASLLAKTLPVCISETTQFYKVPTKPSSQGDKAYVNLTELFAGNNVSFQVPSTQWMIDNQWIHERERNQAFYVKKFEVFLPSKPSVPQKFYTVADPVLHNTLKAESDREYIIVPHVPLVYEYTIGPSNRLPCHSPKIRNPYTLCETNDISEICMLSHELNFRLFPSIYSKWTISAECDNTATPPNPATDLPLIVGIQVCKISSRSAAAVTTAVEEEELISALQNSNQCCSGRNYRPNSASNCARCPSGSTSALAGYYCEKN